MSGPSKTSLPPGKHDWHRLGLQSAGARTQSGRICSSLVIFYFMTGALAARLLGLRVDGTVPKQWPLVAVETGAMTLVALWLWRSGGSAA